MGAFVGRPRKHAHKVDNGQYSLVDAGFTDMPMEPENDQMTSIASTSALLDNLPEGSNTKFIQVIIETHKIAQDADINNVDTLYDCLNRYIEMCRDYDVKITNMGAYQACGLSRDVIDQWASGKKRKNNPEYMLFAQTIRAVCSEYREIVMAEGKLNPITGIWWQKNYDRFQDHPVPLNEIAEDNDEPTSAEIAEKYRDLPDE